MTHTPGPWTENPKDTAAIYANKTLVAVSYGTSYENRYENTKLIAAAPETAAERDRLKATVADMAEALKLIERLSNMPGSIRKEEADLINQATRAALAKAGII